MGNALRWGVVPIVKHKANLFVRLKMHRNITSIVGVLGMLCVLFKNGKTSHSPLEAKKILHIYAYYVGSRGPFMPKKICLICTYCIAS